MTYNTNIIATLINIFALFLNILICSFSIDVIQHNHNYMLLYDLNIPIRCKKIFFYNLIYTGLTCIFILMMGPRLIYNICTSSYRIKWYSGNWFLLLLMLGLHIWIYSDFIQIKYNLDNIYCNNIYKEKYKELLQLFMYQIYCYLMITGIYIFGNTIICILKKFNNSQQTNISTISNPIFNGL